MRPQLGTASLLPSGHVMKHVPWMSSAINLPQELGSMGHHRRSPRLGQQHHGMHHAVPGSILHPYHPSSTSTHPAPRQLRPQPQSPIMANLRHLPLDENISVVPSSNLFSLDLHFPDPVERGPPYLAQLPTARWLRLVVQRAKGRTFLHPMVPLSSHLTLSCAMLLTIQQTCLDRQSVRVLPTLRLAQTVSSPKTPPFLCHIFSILTLSIRLFVCNPSFLCSMLAIPCFFPLHTHRFFVVHLAYIFIHHHL